MLLVVNPVAGGVDKESLVADIEGSFGGVEVLRTVGDGSDLERVRTRLGDHEVVVAIGGDGTVRLAARAIVGTKRSLGVVPAGSANGLAAELGITPRNALKVLGGDESLVVDTLRVNGSLCVHMADIGFNAALMRRFSRRSVRGLFGYSLEALKQLFLGRSFSLSVGEECFSRVSQVTFANGRQYGSGIVINPDGSLVDGRFEVVVASFFGNRHVVSVDRAMVRNVARRPVQVDGEYVGRPRKVEVFLVRGDLRVLAPVQGG